VPTCLGADGGGKANAEEADVEVGAGGTEEDGSSDPRAQALRVPRNVIEGSSRYQQFFFMYAKLMAGIRDSKVRESETTPLAIHKVVISTGNPSLEELDWAICDI